MNPYQSRANLGLECPSCKEQVTGYNLELAFAFDEFVRYRAGEYYILYPCKHPLPLGVQIYDEYIDDKTKDVWIYDPEQDKILLVFTDIIESEE